MSADAGATVGVPARLLGATGTRIPVYRLLLVALAYWISGRLGLLLAIPPGYATAVWPASGIALAALLHWGPRLWPGVFLGSFLINLWTGLDGSSALTVLHSARVPACVAAGAALQAAFGAYLIQRHVGYRNLLTQEMEALRMLVLGGPVACVVNATVGVGALWFSGALPLAALPFNWWTWWIGDSVGVLVFMPLALIWAQPHAQWRRQQWSVTLPLLVMFVAVVCLFVSASRREQSRVLAVFNDQIDDSMTWMQKDADTVLFTLRSVQSFYAASDDVRRDEFERFADHLLEALPGVQALSFDPYVTAAQRAALERTARKEGLSGFQILEAAPQGGLRRAGARPVYVPVLYTATGSVRTAMGYDILSEPRRAAAVSAAMERGAPAASAAITLVQAPAGNRGVLVVVPVRSAHTPAPGPPLGFAVMPLGLDRFLSGALRGEMPTEVQVRLFDDSDGGTQIYGPSSEVMQAGSLQRAVKFEFAGRRWRVDFEMPATALVAKRSWQAWTLLAAGMLFTGLLGMFLLVIVGRTSAIEKQVRDRTLELQSVNSRLLEQTARSQELELEARAQAAQLASSNRELEQFAYVASHDLQAPLRSIAGFVGLIERRYRGQLGPDADEFINAVRGGVSEMQALILDLLRLSRVTGEKLQRGPVPMKDVVARALELLHADLAAGGAQVQVGELPIVNGDAGLLGQLIQNLIGNAIKFQPRGQRALVRVEAVREGNMWKFSVRDNGIGIAPEYLPKLFMMFKRLHRSDEYPGTGIGLALCKKIVTLHRGQIGVESTPGQGTTFYFKLPA